MKERNKTRTFCNESLTFKALYSSLRSDLESNLGFSYSEAGRILNWFDPDLPEYLERVDAWQKLLCAGATPQEVFPLQRKNAFGSYDIWHLNAIQVGAIHQVAKLVYKWHGTPRKETNMEEVKIRLSQPLPITLGQSELAGIRECLKGIRPVDLDYVIGRFGPGATAEGFNAVRKWQRIGAIPDLPPSFFRVNSRDTWSPSSIDEEGMTKIAEVPKSIKCNRIVSSEPAMRMFAQLAVADVLDRQLHGAFHGHVSLHNQNQHNEFLRRPNACSIDLSDASDHISVELVQAVLPQLWPVLAKVRSQLTQFPDGEIIRLGTFAPMGSGVCFVVLTLVVLGIVKYAAQTLGDGRVANYWYSAYGDDIIVPIQLFDYVCSLLSKAGLVVNTAKSCCTLIYRESCGLELYLTEDITPAYIRDPLASADAAKVEQVCTSLKARSFDRTAETVAELSVPCIRARYNRELQRAEVLVRTQSARAKVVSLDGYDGLNRWFATHSQQRLCSHNLLADHQQGVIGENWTRPAWRYKPARDYPFLHSWLCNHEDLTNRRFAEVKRETHKGNHADVKSLPSRENRARSKQST